MVEHLVVVLNGDLFAIAKRNAIVAMTEAA